MCCIECTVYYYTIGVLLGTTVHPVGSSVVILTSEKTIAADSVELFNVAFG